MNIDEEIEKLINNLGEEYKTLTYVYNNDSTFIPGKNNVLYSGPYWDNKEVGAAIKALLTGKWLSSGENIHKFESLFSKKINQKFGTMVNSGSSANLVMILALKRVFNWNDDDEIIVSPVGFPTTIAPIVQNNLKPVFIDIEFNSLNFNIDLIEEKINNRTRGIFVSPVLGNPPNFDKIIAICNKYNLQLILDSCDSLGTTWKGLDLSHYSIASSFSYYPAHHMSCSFDTRIPYLNEDQYFNFDTIENLYNKYNDNPSLIKIYSFDEDSNISWISPLKILRHELKNKLMYRITTKHGRSVDVTEDHSVFILDENLKFKDTEAKNIKTGDYVVTAKEIEIKEKEISINALEYIKKSSLNFNIENFPSSWLKNVEDRDMAFQYKDRNSIPSKFIAEYSDEDLKKMNFGISQSKTKLPVLFKINEDISRLLGYYLAEGSFGRNNCIDISLHKDEIEMFEDIESIFKNNFGLNSYKINVGENGVVVKTDSSTLNWIFRNILDIYSGSHNKRIPLFLYQCSKNIIMAFIYGYTLGDGTERKLKNNHNSIDVTSVSKELLNDFQYLLSRVGISASFYRRNIGNSNKIILGKKCSSSDNYTLKFSGYIYNHNSKTIIQVNKKQRGLVIDQIPINNSIRNLIRGSGVFSKNKTISRKRLKKILKNKNINIPSFLDSNIAFLEVRNIEKINYSNQYVYDFSVPKNENFYGGFLGLFMHNTTGEGGMVTSNNKNVIDIARSSSWWYRQCYCVGSANMLPNGTCNHRFDKWLSPIYNEVIDHKYIFDGLGYNLKPLDLQGAIGLKQLEKLDEIHKRRKNSKEIITNIFLRNIQGLRTPFVCEESDVSWFGTPFICESKELKQKLVSWLEKNLIQTRHYFAGNLLMHPGYSFLDDYKKYPESNKVLDLVFFVGAAPHYDKNIFEYFDKITREFKYE